MHSTRNAYTTCTAHTRAYTYNKQGTQVLTVQVYTHARGHIHSTSTCITYVHIAHIVHINAQYVYSTCRLHAACTCTCPVNIHTCARTHTHTMGAGGSQGSYVCIQIQMCLNVVHVVFQEVCGPGTDTALPPSLQLPSGGQQLLPGARPLWMTQSLFVVRRVRGAACGKTGTQRWLAWHWGHLTWVSSWVSASERAGRLVCRCSAVPSWSTMGGSRCRVRPISPDAARRADGQR